MEKLKCYAAGPWFYEEQERIQTRIENYLRGKDNINPYFPRHDGVKLEANQFHDPNLRKKVFLDNIHNIDDADFLIANLDGREGFMDTGTCYEVGYAMAKGIPVIAYQDDSNGKLKDLMKAIIGEFVSVCTGLEELDSAVEKISKRKYESTYIKGTGSKVLFISPDNTEENINKSADVANVLFECYGKNFRWVDKLKEIDLAGHVDEIFNDIDYLVAVIDDKHPIVSWIMGQAFARHIPIISYTNYDFGINIMLLCSIVTHVKGLNNLKETIQTIKRLGLDSLDTFDSSGIKAF